MVHFTTTIKRFTIQAEKTGWTYIEIPSDIAEALKPGNKKTFRVKGKIDNHPIKYAALMPMGGGKFIMSLNATMRKGIHKKHGAMVEVDLETDMSIYKLDSDFVVCLNDEPPAKKFFESLSTSHQNYFSKWIETAKTQETKAKRIALAINALARKLGFAEMLRERKV